MRVVVFQTSEEKAQGLIGVSPIPAETLFVFPNMKGGGYFHSQGVLEPFEIHFFDQLWKPTGWSYVVKPPMGLVQTPSTTKTVVEAKVGTLGQIGYSKMSELTRMALGS